MMGENSAIEWTDHTFNPWIGCTKVAAGCEHCYAEAFAKRYSKAVWGAHGTRVKTSADYWRKPLKWNHEQSELLQHAPKYAAHHRPRVFCASLADVFEDWDGPIIAMVNKQPAYLGPDWRASSGPNDRATMDDLRRDLFALIDATPHLDWLLLTKRPENIRRIWPAKSGAAVCASKIDCTHPDCKWSYERENVWLLTSVATQADADRNVPELLKCRDLVPVLGLSCEPLLGPIQFPLPCHESIFWTGINWVIAGGESGPHARPMHSDWARSLRDQCVAAQVPFFFKQWGEWAPGAANEFTQWPEIDTRRPLLMPAHPGRPGTDQHQIMLRVGKKAAGRLLDGQKWNEFPKVNDATEIGITHEPIR